MKLSQNTKKKSCFCEAARKLRKQTDFLRQIQRVLSAKAKQTEGSS